MGGAESKPGGSSKMDVSSDKQAGSSINKQKSSLVPANQNKAGSTGPDESSTSPIAENQALMVTANVNTVGWGHEQASDTNGPSSQYGSQSQKQNSQGQNIHQHATKKDQGQPNQIPRHGQISAKGKGSTNTDKHQVGKDSQSKINILLVGTSGQGKSSTGNIIFDSDDFKTSNSMETSPDEIVCETKTVNDLRLTICDALTIQDERMFKPEAKKYIKERLKLCFKECEGKFHFIIFVFSCTSRVTPELTVADEILQNEFGKDFLTKNAICVFTHGENFDLQKDNSNIPDFNTWCQNTQDPLLRTFVRRKMKQFLLYKKDTGKNVDERRRILDVIRNSCTPVTAVKPGNTAPSYDGSMYPWKRLYFSCR